MVLQDSHPHPLNHQELKIDLLQDILNFPPTFNCFRANGERHKMITNSREKDFSAKKEGESSDNKITKGSSSSSTQWLGLKDPRVVRVSRSFGGKDRHSKVCTVRGLRDRRVRLSVQTAIQLYDLQDRLGFNQPSKVVDWLLNVAKHEIDDLPPLQMPPGSFGQFPRSIIVPHEGNGLQSSLASLVGANTNCVKDDGSHSLQSGKEVCKINDNVQGGDQTTEPKFTRWNLNAPLKSKCKGVAQETIKDKSNWIKRNEQESQEDVEVQDAQVSYQNSLPRATFPGLLNNAMPYYHWDPSNLSLSHLGSGNHGFSNQSAEDPHNYNVVSMPTPLMSLPSASQLLFCTSATQPSFFPPYVATQVECNPRQINQFQMLSSSSQNLFANSLSPSLYSISQPIRPSQLSITPELLRSQSNNNGSQSSKGNSGPSSAFTSSSSFQNDPKATFE